MVWKDTNATINMALCLTKDFNLVVVVGLGRLQLVSYYEVAEEG